MNSYNITFEDRDGEVVQECIYADTLKEAKAAVKENYNVKKSL